MADRASSGESERRKGKEDDDSSKSKGEPPQKEKAEAREKNNGNGRASGSLPPPLVIRNAPTRLMKDLGYGAGYQYAHDEEGRVADQQHLPDDLTGKRFYEPTGEGFKAEIARRMKAWEGLIEKKRAGGKSA